MRNGAHYFTGYITMEDIVVNETNKFKIWDWDALDWLQQNEYESVLQFNWHTRGDDEGVCWGEITQLKGRNLCMIFDDNLGNYKKPTDE